MIQRQQNAHVMYQASNGASVISTKISSQVRRGQDLPMTDALNINNDTKSSKTALPSCSGSLCCGVACDTITPALLPLQNASHHLPNDEDTYQECLVCWDCIKDTDGPQDCLPCGHVFHRACINDWRYCNQSCPTCRIDLEFAEMHC